MVNFNIAINVDQIYKVESYQGGVTIYLITDPEDNNNTAIRVYKLQNVDGSITQDTKIIFDDIMKQINS